MKKTELLMDMPVTVEIADEAEKQDVETVYDYFRYVDETFSTFKKGSEISKINQGKLKISDSSQDMKEIFAKAEETKKLTLGYFDIRKDTGYDPSGIVKGWAILNAAKILRKKGYRNFFIDAGGDIQIDGQSKNKNWSVGIRNPFNRFENIKILSISNRGVATSGTYIRGQHIYNPFNKDLPIKEIVSLTVIGPDVYEADRFATAAFAMGKKGIEFIERLKDFEGYMVDKKGMATYTSGFSSYLCNNGENN